MKRLLMIGAVIALVVTGQDAQAQSHIDRTQVNHHKRIVDGVQRGKLTPREARILKIQQAHIRDMKRLAKADRVVTRGERIIINRAQACANRNVYRKKHNRRTRY